MIVPFGHHSATLRAPGAEDWLVWYEVISQQDITDQIPLDNVASRRPSYPGRKRTSETPVPELAGKSTTVAGCVRSDRQKLPIRSARLTDRSSSTDSMSAS